METLALVVMSLYLGIYGWLAGLEFGVALLRLEKHEAKQSESLLTQLHPLWEASNVFLLIGVLAFALPYGKALRFTLHPIRPLIMALLIALIARIALLAYVYFQKVPRGSNIANWAFMLAALAVPLSLGSIGIYMITGLGFWGTLVGAAGFVSVLTFLFALGYSFLLYLDREHSRRQVLASVSNAAFVFVTALAFIGLVNAKLHHLLLPVFAAFILIVVGALILQVYGNFKDKMWWLWPYLSVVAVVAPALVMLANKPYFVFRRSLLVLVYTKSTHNTASVVTLAILLGILLICAWLFFDALLPVFQRLGASETVPEAKPIKKTAAKRAKK